MGQGAVRLSAKGLRQEIEDAKAALFSDWHTRRQSSKTYLFDGASHEVKDFVEKVRKGEADNERKAYKKRCGKN